MKKTSIVLLAAVLLVACSSGDKSSEDTSSEQTSSMSSEDQSSLSSEESSGSGEKTFSVHQAPFYKPSYANYDYQAAKVTDFNYGYFDDNPCFIYVSIDEALSFFFKDSYKEDISIHFYTYETTSGLKITIDSEEDKMTFYHYDEVNLFSLEYDVTPLAMIDEGHTLQYVSPAGTFDYGEDVVFDLNKYDLQIVEKDNKVYVPFSIINQIFFVNKYYSGVGFNGTAFYLLDLTTGAFSLSGSSYTYGLEYYNGAFRGKKRSEVFIKDNFKALMFQFDHFYGFLDERFVPFEKYLNENYPDVINNLMDPSHSVYTQGVNYILEFIIGDGHTNTGRASTVFGTGSVSSSVPQSQRSIELNNAYYECYNALHNSGVDPSSIVRFKNDTAIVSFDGFYHQPVEFTKSNIDNYKKYDGFALFYYAFNEISKKNNIKNVIFDLTYNGGGDTNALIPMLGFLTREVKTTMYNPLSKAVGNSSYKVDTNLDGVYDENDSFEGKYNYFVLTSHFSFSCANLFTQVCKNSGLAKIIGQQSGGGACVVQYTCTPDGKPFRISGLSRSGSSDNPSSHVDYGVTVDIEIEDVNNFYNDDYLSNLVENVD